MLNRTILIGRLTSDPELRYTQSGTAVASFTLAVDRNDKEKNTDFIPVAVWQKQAEMCAQYLHKGRTAAVDGRIQVRSYENREGQKVRVTEVVAENVRFLDKGGNNDGGTKQISQSTQSARSYDDPFADDTPLDVDTDNLPF